MMFLCGILSDFHNIGRWLLLNAVARAFSVVARVLLGILCVFLHVAKVLWEVTRALL